MLHNIVLRNRKKTPFARKRILSYVSIYIEFTMCLRKIHSKHSTAWVERKTRKLLGEL